MAINTTDILVALSQQGRAPHLGTTVLNEMKWLEGVPVEVNWPDDKGTGSENRRVIQVSIENSGTPEKPTLRLICGPTYSDDPTEMDNFQPTEYAVIVDEQIERGK